MSLSISVIIVIKYFQPSVRLYSLPEGTFESSEEDNMDSSAEENSSDDI